MFLEAEEGPGLGTSSVTETVRREAEEGQGGMLYGNIEHMVSVFRSVAFIICELYMSGWAGYIAVGPNPALV